MSDVSSLECEAAASPPRLTAQTTWLWGLPNAGRGSRSERAQWVAWSQGPGSTKGTAQGSPPGRQGSPPGRGDPEGRKEPGCHQKTILPSLPRVLVFCLYNGLNAMPTFSAHLLSKCLALYWGHMSLWGRRRTQSLLRWSSHFQRGTDIKCIFT